MEKTLQKIANLLILNFQNIENLGLINGKMGVAIFLYHYARHSFQSVYSDQADDLLDELFAALNESHFLIDGVSSIGFGLDHLIKNRFIETDENPDELFKDVDVRLSIDMDNQCVLDLRSNFPIFSVGFYTLSRIKTTSRTVQKNKLLKSSLEGIDKIFSYEKQWMVPVFTNSIIRFLIGVSAHGLYKKKVEKLQKKALLFVLNTFTETTYRPIDIAILQYLLSSAKSDSGLVDKIMVRINQFEVSPYNDSDIDTVLRDLQQLSLYPNLSYPDIPKLSIEKYIDDCIEASSFPNLSLLPHIGLNIMGVKLC